MSKKTVYKLVILNNLVTPYRIPLYQGLGSRFSTYLLLSGKESNRDTWTNLESSLSNVHVRDVWGFTLQFFEKRRGKIFDPRYLHINPGYCWELLKIRPDAVISAEMGFRSLIALAYGFLFRRPVWILWGGTLLTEKNRSYLKRLLRQVIFRRVTRWISYGQTTTDYLLHLGVDRSYILQIQNCIDEGLYQNDHLPVLRLSPSPTLLYAGQFIKRKGVDLFLQAAKKLQQEGYHFSILLVGSGVEQEKLTQIISQLNLKNITVLPSQTPKQMPAVYKSADVFVFPTLEEVLGLVVNEAIWSGLTVVSSIYAGCAEEILPHENLFDPLDQDSFVCILRKAIMGELAAPTVNKLYTASQVVEMISNELMGELTSKDDRTSQSILLNTTAEGNTLT